MRAARFIRCVVLSTILGLVVSCTDNPFVAGEEVSPRSIGGRVLLADGSSPGGVFVWLEDVRVSTWTDEKGEFVLSLPAPSQGGGVTGHSGTFSLYFYVANYGIDSAQVVLVNGDVARSRGDLDERGKLADVIHLKRILTIHTDVIPESFPRYYRGQVAVSVTLRALSDDVTVESLKKVENRTLSRSGLIIVDQAGNFVNAIGFGTTWQLAPEIVSRESKALNMVLTWPPCELQEGLYTMIPYLLIRQGNMPPELVEDMGEDVDDLGPSYLTMPFRRDGGEFFVGGG
ncbi:MAG: hypothetical protein ACE5HZ_04520 [Fidelibacterota bacterium]